MVRVHQTWAARTNLCPHRRLCEVLVRRLRGWEEPLRDRGWLSGGVCQAQGVSGVSPAASEGALHRGLQGVALRRLNQPLQVSSETQNTGGT